MTVNQDRAGQAETLIDSWVAGRLAEAPPLGPEQRARLSALLNTDTAA